MADQLIESVVTIALAITGIAIIAVLVSRNAQTPDVLLAGGQAFSQSLRAAEGPVLAGYGGYTNAPSYNSYY